MASPAPRPETSPVPVTQVNPEQRAWPAPTGARGLAPPLLGSAPRAPSPSAIPDGGIHSATVFLKSGGGALHWRRVSVIPDGLRLPDPVAPSPA
jgi:hypothetical protein